MCPAPSVSHACCLDRSMHAFALDEQGVPECAAGAIAASSVTTGLAAALASVGVAAPPVASTAPAASATMPGARRHTDRNQTLATIGYPSRCDAHGSGRWIGWHGV